MATLFGLFSTREAALQTQERLRQAGLTVHSLDDEADAAELARQADTTDSGGRSAGTGSGAALGALAGGLIGAVPGALVGKLVGRGLSEQTAERYQQEVAAGGMVLLVEAPEVAPAAQAEALLREGGALHVHTGEAPPA